MSHRALVDKVARIQRGSRLKQQKPAFFICNGTVLHPARHHNELALFDPLMPVEKFHAEPSLHHKEHLVFVLMMMKHELAFQFVELHMLPVQLGGDVGLPVFLNPSEFVGDVDLVHGASPLVRMDVQILSEVNWSQKKSSTDRSAWSGLQEITD
jgi:hypothetical protein